MVSTRLTKPVVLAAVLLFVLAGCAMRPSAAPDATQSDATPSTSSVPAVSTCVGDRAAVVSRTAALPTTAMSSDLTATIDKAAEKGFAQAAAPGAIVAVQSPKGLFVKAYGVADPS
ncbi:MAG: serine hydrolase, partial [Humibacter sp.]